MLQNRSRRKEAEGTTTVTVYDKDLIWIDEYQTKHGLRTRAEAVQEILSTVRKA